LKIYWSESTTSSEYFEPWEFEFPFPCSLTSTFLSLDANLD
jgi:hypothetical protein